MGRAPCCDKSKVKRGAWSPEEDITLRNYLHNHAYTAPNWISLPQKAGLKRCGKSCRLRWLNYLRPDIKRGGFSEEEDNIILTLYDNIGSRWSIIASHLQGRTDNDVKNYWNTKLKKKKKKNKLLTAPETITSTTATSNNISFNTWSANNSMYTTIAGNQTMYYENDHIDLTSSFMGINSQSNNVPEQVPKLTEVEENRLNKSTQQVSSISPSFPLEEGGQDIFLMDITTPGSSGSSCDLLQGINVDFQADSEVSPNLAKCMYSSFFDISNTKPSSSGFHYY